MFSLITICSFHYYLLLRLLTGKSYLVPSYKYIVESRNRIII